ncbi:MAG: sugar ABC transporter permease [Tyzzerella sp.]|nr:sugar ABC transporter permease [Tyzzerella sp.]
MAFTDKDGALSFENFVRFWEELNNPVSDIRIAFRNTFLTFGIIVVTFPLKVLVSYFIYKKVPLAGVYRILFFLPSIIFSVALAMIFQKMISVNGFIAQWVQDWLNLSQPPELLADSRFANTVVILHMLWLTFPGDLIIWGGTFTRIPNDVLESAQIDGVNWWKEFTMITVPMVWPTVALQMVLMFCGIFGASGAVFLLTKGMYGTMTISAWMYLQLYNLTGSPHTSNAYNYMSAVGLIITVIAIGISLGIRKWTDKAFEEVEF